MTSSSSSIDSKRSERHALGWLLFPLALFPLVALLTYDWHAIESLQTPPRPSSNWIGSLGDAFAYAGYSAVGLAIWIVPALCIAAGLCRITGRRLHSGMRKLWLLASITSSACLMQAAQGHAPGIDSLLSSLNISAAGGVVGYLLMDKLLAPLIGDFGAIVLVTIVLAISLVCTVGIANLAKIFSAICKWMLAGGARADRAADDDGDSPEDDDEQAAYLAALRAKEAAKRQREEEKRLAKEEKLREKEERRMAKEQAKEMAAAQKQQRAALAKAPAAAGQDQAAPMDKGPYVLPPIDLLNPIPRSMADHGDVGEMSERLVKTLKIFGIDATLNDTVQGPVVTKYKIALAPGTRYSAVTSLSDNLMGALHAKSLRIEAPIPGEDLVGIEVPNRKAVGISFREIFESDAWKNSKAELPLLFGKDAAGKELVADLASMPHMLVAGATGQGKSVCLNSLINGQIGRASSSRRTHPYHTCLCRS